MSEVAPDIRWTLFTAGQAVVPPPGVDAQIIVVPGSIKSLRRPFWEVGRLPGALKRSDIDVFLSSYGVVPLRCPVATVSVVHDLAFLQWPKVVPLRYRIYWRWVAWTVRRASQIVVPSTATRNQVVSRFEVDGGRVHVIPHGFAPAFVRKPKQSVDRIRNRFGLPQKFVLAVGTLEPRKNLPLLIAAMDRINERRVDPVGLVLAGRRGWGEAVEDRSWLFWVQGANDCDLADLYSAATVFAMPSLDEGFGLPALEAMACGAPVVVAEAGALPEVVGDAGLQVAPSDIDGWAQALTSVLFDAGVATDMGELSAARAKDFSWIESARAVADILRRAGTRD